MIFVKPHQSLPDQVGVLGGGQMGAGIAHAFLIEGASVIIVERDDSSADAARQRVAQAIEGSVSRGLIDTGFVRKDQLRISTRHADFHGCELVVEAVPEIMELKQSSLKAIEDNVDHATLIGTNTSSLSISGMSTVLQHPQRFFGMHFFNPVPASKLIELIVGESTSEETIELARAWARNLGKEPIVAQDVPGFASSRLGMAIALEAMRMLEEEVASASDIDTAMELGYRHQTGPLRTSDLVGLDVRLDIARYLESKFGDRFTPPQILLDLVSQGNLGRKSGSGFFDWS